MSLSRRRTALSPPPPRRLFAISLIQACRLMALSAPRPTVSRESPAMTISRLLFAMNGRSGAIAEMAPPADDVTRIYGRDTDGDVALPPPADVPGTAQSAMSFIGDASPPPTPLCHIACRANAADIFLLLASRRHMSLMRDSARVPAC